MKRTALWALPLILILIMTALKSGCSKPEQADYASEPAFDHGAEDSIASYQGGVFGTNSPSEVGDYSADNPFAGSRKYIRNAELAVQTLEFDSFISDVVSRMKELGGYIESNVTGKSGYNYYYYEGSGSQNRKAEMVLRIPAEHLDEFLETVNGLGVVISRNETAADVTENYTDVEAKLASLNTEYDSLLKLLEKAETLNDIITLQDRLTNVRYEIEKCEKSLRSYDAQIAYSKVSLTVYEVERAAQVEEETFGQEVSRRFRESLEDVGEGFKDFAAWFIGDLPRIIIWLMFLVVIPLVIVLIIVKSVKRKNARRAKKAAEQAEKTA